MNQTIKNFWANRRQNAWIVVEIALVAILSFYFLDYFVVSFYDTHLCRPAGDFERDHLVVGQVGMSPQAASPDADNTHCKMAFIHMDDNNDRLNWENASRENFSMPPMLYQSDSPFKLTLLQMKGLSASDISILDN